MGQKKMELMTEDGCAMERGGGGEDGTVSQQLPLLGETVPRY